MTTALMIRDVEDQAKKIDLTEYFLNIISGQVSSYNGGFKQSLKGFQNVLESTTSKLGLLKEANQNDLRNAHSHFKRLSIAFDKLNDLYYSSDYFEDEELKKTFRSITRNLHKMENVSSVYLNQHLTSDSTPDYIKDGLSNFNKENIAKKLTAEN